MQINAHQSTIILAGSFLLILGSVSSIFSALLLCSFRNSMLLIFLSSMHMETILGIAY